MSIQTQQQQQQQQHETRSKSLWSSVLSVLWEFWSWLLSIPDLVFPIVNSLLPWGPKFFSQGYGDPDIYFKRLHQTIAAAAGGANGPYMTQHALKEGKNLHVKETRRKNGLVYYQGTFQSPMAALFPQESRYCQFVMVEPQQLHSANNNNSTTSTSTSPPVYIFLFPSTGEMGNGMRLAMAERLAHKYGWASVIPTAAFYGSRKPRDQLLFFFNSVTNILLHSEGVIEEGMLLTNWIMSERSPQALVCHSGFSHGACTCAYTSVGSLLVGLDGSRMACAPYTGFASPGVLADGILQSVLQWRALAPSSKQHLFELLDQSQLSLLTCHTNDNKLAVIRGMSFERDGVIQAKYTHEMQRQLAHVAADGHVPVQWLPGGHITAGITRPYFQQRLIEQAVQELIVKTTTTPANTTTTRVKAD
ncbi:Uncharacterized conserved protein (DUF2048) [Seminavis robusta]|uniref:Uncharacterized conserved protein (DUF2048) n=1 Tax=Seminavis robusta TaxID=568900 RepID=A0A9N8EYX4_9STRA|nr:Uncharacterized conserved protein (DUF2048) [Seminavis robusta]|eukprot:Sro1971_g308570.1 Uncharacterized conserved protein (DUF2048) (418) ;mRNA; f:4681-5934